MGDYKLLPLLNEATLVVRPQCGNTTVPVQRV